MLINSLISNQLDLNQLVLSDKLRITDFTILDTTLYMWQQVFFQSVDRCRLNFFHT